jgi:hypothetical protein
MAMLSRTLERTGGIVEKNKTKCSELKARRAVGDHVGIVCD